MDRWILSSHFYTTSVTSLLQQLQLESLKERSKVQQLASCIRFWMVKWQSQQLL